MSRFFKLAASAGIFALGFASLAQAGPAWEFTTPGSSFTNGSWDFGTDFGVNTTVTVSGLGYYADPITGNADGNQTALYQCTDSTCTATTGPALASVTVDNTNPLTGHFRYDTISPITLIAGDYYQVDGVSNVDNYTWNDPGFATDPAITYLANTWTSNPIGADFQGFVQNDVSDGYWGPGLFLGAATFAAPAPEPASLALFGAGLARLRLIRRRKRT